MVRIPADKWITLKQLMDELDDGTTEANLLTDVCLAFKDGLVDDRGLLLIDEVSVQPLSPNVRQLYPYVFPLRDRIFVSKQVADNLRLQCNRSPPSGCADAIKGASQPSRSPEQLSLAPEATIRTEIGSAYDHAEANGEKPPNIKEVSRAVQLVLEQKGSRASRRQIEKLAEADEFKLRRWPPGKRRSEPRNK
jgi:hypothetical protein